MSPLPSKIGRYEIKSLIGRGGMGALYLASDPKTNRLVALKVLSETLDSSEFRARFDREVRALAALNHPNIVNIYDYDTGELEHSPFIVMEYVRGETLAEMIKRRAPLPLSQKLKLMAELCAGLAQAHDAGIIHRDIKPANLMVDQQGRLKILDFGIARVADGHGHGTRVNLPLTQVDMVIGTPGYMSPEQIEGGEVDHRSDIFAVGAMCYELLSYREAFSGTTTRQVERQVLQGQPTPLGSLVPGLDPEINEIVLRALKKDPNKRYQDAATFEKALERLRSRLEADDSGPLPRPAPLPPQRASRDPRAEAAYQRALAAAQAGAPDPARRFAIEALAHDPSHAEARALLARLDSRSALPATNAASTQAPSTAVPTWASQTASSTTAVGTAAARTPAQLSAATIIVPPPTAGPPKRWTRYQDFWSSDGPLRRRWDRIWKRDPTPWNRQRHEPPWTRYRWPLLAIALLVLVAGIAASAVFFGLSLPHSGQLLTITKPTGGSISASGIRCGSRGADCSAMRPTGDAIELTTEADAGFEFGGYTGDCAPGGRTLMTMPRTCGATFVKIEALPAATQTLTIAPVPTGGTLEAVDIICGTKGSVCSANHPEGAPVELHATADPGFTFMGFVGDCVPLGHTQMTAPRTCGATFSPTEIANRPPPVAPSRNLARGASRGAPVTPGTDKAKPGGEGPPVAAGPVAQGGGGAGEKPGVSPNTTVVPTTTTILPPISPEEFAKGKIQEVLKKYCDANVALDPVAVQRVFPTVNMVALQNQLNKSKYNSVECKFGGPEFVNLDPEKGTAEVRAELKRVYSHTLEAKPKPDEQITDVTLSRPMERADWQIVAMKFRPKPK